MTRLELKRNFLNYRATFMRPPLVLWGDGARIFAGMLDALDPFGIDLSAFSQDATSEKPGEQGISVNLTANFRYRFMFGGPQLDLVDFSGEDLVLGARVVGAVEEWLRSVETGLQFTSHMYLYSAHLVGEGLRSEEILRALPGPDLPILGRNRGTALTFHAGRGDSEKIQLTIDHSLVMKDGVYVQFVQIVSKDRVEHEAHVDLSQALLRDALGAVGLEVEEWE